MFQNRPTVPASNLLFVSALGKEWRERVQRCSRTEASTTRSGLATRKKEDDVVIVQHVVSLSTAFALLRALVRVIYLYLQY